MKRLLNNWTPGGAKPLPATLTLGSLRQRAHAQQSRALKSPIVISRLVRGLRPAVTMLLTLSALLFLLVSPASARDVVKGQTALISFAKIPPNSSVVFENKTIPLLAFPNHPDKKFVLVPVAYRTAPGDEMLFIRYPGGEKKVTLRIENGHYHSETITVAPAKVTPNPKQKKRTQAEYAEAMKIYNSVTPRRYWHAPFIAPMSSPITSPFGTARLYNGSLKSFHSGTDFKAAPGTEVIAANDGVVALAKNRYYAGNSVIVDHGEGLYTCYYHLSRIDVKRGQKIKRGQHLGLSGATGRVTGPHLHFAAMLYGVQVDPLQLIAQVNSLFEQPDR